MASGMENKQWRKQLNGNQLSPVPTAEWEICFRCNAIFKSGSELEDHLYDAHPPFDILCVFCGLLFRGEQTYFSHVKARHPERVTCQILGCLTHADLPAEMRQHLAQRHEGSVKCPHCEFGVPGPNATDALDVHLAKQHSQTAFVQHTGEKLAMPPALPGSSKSENCGFCKSSVEMRKSHFHFKEIVCYRCKVVLKCSGLFQEHMESCLGHRFRCEECPKTFMIPSELKYHVKKKHGEKRRDLQFQNLGHQCNTCDTFYNSKNSLRIHISRYHNEANKKQCAHCPKKFSRIELLKIHLANVHNLIECKFKCAECKKNYLSQHLLNHHIRYSHQFNKSKVMCPICENEIQANYLKVHMKNKH